jgi:hypothetical protein
MGDCVRLMSSTKGCFLTHVTLSPAFIAGVTNPIFESFDSWDVLCDISNGRIAVSKDIVSRYPVTATALSTHTGLLSRTGTLKSESSAADEEMGRMSTNAQKGDFNPKTDNSDNLFIEDVRHDSI